jgi:hypothetical protein
MTPAKASPNALEKCTVPLSLCRRIFLFLFGIQQNEGGSHENTRVDFDGRSARAGNDGHDGQCSNPITGRGELARAT